MERIWIYQADRKLTESEQDQVKSTLEAFTSQWKAHGKKLAASAEIRYGIFVILMVNDSIEAPSGCSIDKSVYLLKDLEEELGVGFFDRMRIAYRVPGSKSIELATKAEFEKLIQEGVVNLDTHVFNNLIQDYGELDTKWEVPISASWHAKYFGMIA